MSIDDFYIKQLISGSIIFNDIPYDRQQIIKNRLKKMVDDNELDIKKYNDIMYNSFTNPDLTADDYKNEETHTVVDMDIDSFNLQSEG